MIKPPDADVRRLMGRHHENSVRIVNDCSSCICRVLWQSCWSRHQMGQLLLGWY